MYLRGTSVTVNTGNLTIHQGSLVLSNGYGVQAKDTSGNSAYILSLNSSNQVSVGNASYPTYLRGSGVYLSSTGATVTSDRRKENSIEALPDAYEALLDKIEPVRFKFNDGNSGRYHAGFIAQDVKAALEAAGLTTKDFGGFVDVNGDGEELGLIYGEFIALLLHKIKRQEQRIAALEAVH
ncbi:MAG: tail fiber domain-containing protein [Clostridia bacterium]|nr:tail fiber domain-containing protein [Clostridia bacterium]